MFFYCKSKINIGQHPASVQHLPRDQQHNVFLYALTLVTSTGQSSVWGSARPEGITAHCSTLGRHSIAQSAARCSCHSCPKVSSYQLSYSLLILKVYAQQRLLIGSKSDLIIITWLCSSVISFSSWDKSSPASNTQPVFIIQNTNILLLRRLADCVAGCVPVLPCTAFNTARCPKQVLPSCPNLNLRFMEIPIKLFLPAQRS